MSDSSKQPAGEPKLGGRCGPSEGKVLSKPGANNGGAGRPQDKQCTVLPRLLTIQQAADYVGVSHWTIRSWLDRGVLAAVRLPAIRAGLDGRLIRVELAALDRLIEQSRPAG
jgi:excisionase family DNA binding protein